MDKIIRRADNEENIEMGAIIMKVLAYAENLILLIDSVAGELHARSLG